MTLNAKMHRIIMLSIIQDIFKSKIGKYFWFKWWTACYFLYWLDRFSTDLDFDLLDENQHIDEQLIDIVSKYWKIKKWNKIEISYWEKDVNIKIDVNRHIWKENRYEVLNLYWTPLSVQTKDTIFANKLVAYYERWTNRDIYDIYFFLKNGFDINEWVVFERTGMSVNKVLEETKNKLLKLPKNYKILDWLWEVLSLEQKNYTKNFLVRDLIWFIDMTVHYWE